jgi:hypothetical protein
MWRKGRSTVPAVPGRTRAAVRSGAESETRGSVGLAPALVGKQEHGHGAPKAHSDPHQPQSWKDGGGAWGEVVWRLSGERIVMVLMPPACHLITFPEQ